MLSTWRHSDFHVFCGTRISPKDDTAMENLARHIIRASFSQERMQYLDQGEGRLCSRRRKVAQDIPYDVNFSLPGKAESHIAYF